MLPVLLAVTYGGLYLYCYTAHLILHHRKDLVVVDLTLAGPLIEKYHLETEIYQDIQAAG